MANKPASRRISKALPRGAQYAAQFALPGLVPDLVKGSGGKAELFGTERDAEIAAMEACLNLYDSRIVDTRKAAGYTRLSGADLSALLVEMDITATYFAEIAGVPQHRVLKWLDGEQDIPHSVHVLARLMAENKSNLQRAEEITEKCQD